MRLLLGLTCIPGGPRAVLLLGCFRKGGGLIGLRTACRQFLASTETLTSFVRHHMPGHPFTTISVYLNTGTEPHRDSRNACIPNGLIALSDFSGGEVWTECEGGDSFQFVDGKRLAGRLVPITADSAYIHAYRDLHFTMPWTGRRLVIIAFSVADHEQAPQDVLSTLRGQAFVLPGEISQEAHLSFTAAAEDTGASGDSDNGSTSEGPEPSRQEDCHNAGPPLSLEWDGKVEPVNDGFGLCSPTRWPPAARGARLPARAAGFTKAMHQVLRGFIDRNIPDARRTAMELALGRLKSSPFPPEVLEGLREEWFGCIEAALGVRSSELREVLPNQPFCLRAISSTAQLLEDPDWEAIACQKDSYVTGVAIGFDEPVPHLPQVYEFKVKSRKPDDSEDEWHRDNYSSAKQTIEQLEQKFKEEEALGRMAPSTLPVLEQKYGKDRVRIASLGSLLKPDGSARPLHDGTHGVRVNNGIRMLNQQANPVKLCTSSAVPSRVKNLESRSDVLPHGGCHSRSPPILGEGNRLATPLLSSQG